MQRLRLPHWNKPHFSDEQSLGPFGEIFLVHSLIPVMLATYTYYSANHLLLPG